MMSFLAASWSDLAFFDATNVGSARQTQITYTQLSGECLQNTFHSLRVTKEFPRFL